MPGKRSRHTTIAHDFVGAWLLTILATVSISCGRAERPQPNIVLISVDTLRWDHVGLYGYARDTTPNLDRFFRSRTVFRNAGSPAPCTLPAVPQFLSGSFLVDPDRASLAQILRERGYDTTAIVSQHQFHGRSPWVVAVRKGFSIFDVQAPHDVDRHGNSLRTAEDVSDRALRWLRGAPEREPFFIWLHYFDPHDPYTPPQEFDRFAEVGLSSRSGDRRHYLMTERGSTEEPWQRAGSIFDDGDVSHFVNLYDGEIRNVDFQIGRFLNAADESGIVDRSIIIFTADHGEWLGEEDRWDHCQTLQETEIRVPLFISDRGQELPLRGGLDMAVSTLDIVPTVLGRLDIDPGPWSFDGDDLSRVPDDRPVFSSWIQYSALRSGRWKLLRKPSGVALFDIVRDPYENSDRSGEESAVRARLETSLDEFLISMPPIDNQNRVLLERLRSLGYID